MKIVFPFILLLLMTSLSYAQKEEMEELPTLEEMEIPSAEELLTGTSIDWIVLNSGEVFEVESLVSRPDTLAKRQKEVEAKQEERRKAPPNQRDRLTEELNDLAFLEVTLPDVQGNPEYRISIKQIAEIIHHEDLMIKRIYELLRVGNIEKSLELLNRLRREWETWPGLDEVHKGIVFADGKLRVTNGEYASALVILDEVHHLNPEFPGLSTQMGIAVENLVKGAISEDAFPRAQFYLNWLRQRFPQHEVYQAFSAQLTEKTNQLLAQAEAASIQGKVKLAADLASQAARVWPLTANLRNRHRPFVERFQRLEVGVVELPGQTDAYFASSPGDLRKRRLTGLSLFELDRLRDGTAYYRTRFFDEWEPTDLGREMHFKLKQFRQPFEIQSTVSTSNIVPLIMDRIDPNHPDHDERLASYVKSVEIHSPTEFSLIFRRVPPRIEPLLAQITVEINANTTSIGPTTDPGGFQVVETGESSITYSRKLEEPEGLPKYHVAEIVERKYDSYEKAAQGLIRGEVSMIPDLPDWIVRRMQEDEEFVKEFFVVPYQLPETQLLQFNPASEAMRSRELRTALAYAVDREGLLKDVVLRDPEKQNGRVVTTPFISSNPGRNIVLEPRRYDLTASLAMLMASQKQMKGGIPSITMIVAPGPIAEEVAQKIAEKWEKIGLKVTLVFAHEPRPKQWDVILRSVQMVEPLIELWPFLTIQDRARIEDLRKYPDWLKQELIELDRTTDQSRAIVSLQTLHRHLWSDSAVFPLWELQRFMVIRNNIQGYPKTLMHCYDQVDRWMIDAWYQTELP